MNVRYEVVVEDILNAYILDKEENEIVCLCSTKRPDLGFKKLQELVGHANKTELLKEENQWLYGKLNMISDFIERGRYESEQYKQRRRIK